MTSGLNVSRRLRLRCQSVVLPLHLCGVNDPAPHQETLDRVVLTPTPTTVILSVPLMAFLPVKPLWRSQRHGSAHEVCLRQLSTHVRCIHQGLDLPFLRATRLVRLNVPDWTMGTKEWHTAPVTFQMTTVLTIEWRIGGARFRLVPQTIAGVLTVPHAEGARHHLRL